MKLSSKFVKTFVLAAALTMFTLPALAGNGRGPGDGNGSGGNRSGERTGNGSGTGECLNDVVFLSSNYFFVYPDKQ